MTIVLTREELCEAIESYWGYRRTGMHVKVKAVRVVQHDHSDDTIEFQVEPINVNNEQKDK